MKRTWDATMHPASSSRRTIEDLLSDVWRTYGTPLSEGSPWGAAIRAMCLRDAYEMLGLDYASDPVVKALFERVLRAAQVDSERRNREFSREMEADVFRGFGHNVAAYVVLVALRSAIPHHFLHILLHAASVIPVANLMALMAEGPHEHDRRRRMWWRSALPIFSAYKAVILFAPPLLRAASFAGVLTWMVLVFKGSCARM